MIARVISTLGYTGLLRPAPGTWGSLVAILLAALIYAAGGFVLLLALWALAFAIGWWSIAVETAGKEDHDPSEIVIDELVGQWIPLFPLAYMLWLHENPLVWLPWPGLVFGFIFFRIFDIWKPWPVSWADQKATPFGVMLDDVFAGVMAAIVVTVMGAVAHGVMGA